MKTKTRNEKNNILPSWTALACPKTLQDLKICRRILLLRPEINFILQFVTTRYFIATTIIQSVSVTTNLDVKKPGQYPVLFSNKNAICTFEDALFFKENFQKVENKGYKLQNWRRNINLVEASLLSR